MTIFRDGEQGGTGARPVPPFGHGISVGDAAELAHAETLLDLLVLARDGSNPTGETISAYVAAGHRARWLDQLRAARTSALPSVVRHGLVGPDGDTRPALTTFVPFFSGGRVLGVHLVMVDLTADPDAQDPAGPAFGGAAVDDAGLAAAPAAVRAAAADRPAATATTGMATSRTPDAVQLPPIPQLSVLTMYAVASASASITIADVSQPDAPLVYANNAFENLTGYAVSDVLGRNCRFLQGPDTDPAVTAAIREAMGAERTITAVLRNYRRDGSAFVNQLSLAPVRGDDGVVTHYIGYQLDVTQGASATR